MKRYTGLACTLLTLAVSLCQTSAFPITPVTTVNQQVTPQSTYCKSPQHLTDHFLRMQETSDIPGAYQNVSVIGDSIAEAYVVSALSYAVTANLTSFEAQCPDPVAPDKHSSNVYDRSTCVSDTYLDFDRNRVPSLLAQTICCKQDEEYNCHGRTGSMKELTSCHKVNTVIPVLKLGCRNGVYDYYEDTESVTIACICALDMTS